MERQPVLVEAPSLRLPLLKYIRIRVQSKVYWRHNGPFFFILLFSFLHCTMLNPLIADSSVLTWLIFKSLALIFVLYAFYNVSNPAMVCSGRSSSSAVESLHTHTHARVTFFDLFLACLHSYAVRQAHLQLLEVTCTRVPGSIVWSLIIYNLDWLPCALRFFTL